MLQVIAANPGLTQNRLAEVMEVDRSAIFKVVNQLEARGLILRAPSDLDRRSNCLRLTEHGQASLARLEARVKAHEADLTKSLTPRRGGDADHPAAAAVRRPIVKSILSLTLNGRRRDDLVADNMLLLDYLRDVAGMTGT
jgi:DNA-binding Lrp family transcriptional regulator